MINDQGGINGRKINLITLDDAFSPPKTVEQTRKLIEQEGVAIVFGSIGGATNMAVRKYLNDRRVPQLFALDPTIKFDDPQHFPWTMGFQPTIYLEGQVHGRYILKHKPDAKIGVLYQNEEVAKEGIAGLREALREKSKQILKELSFELSDPTVDS